MRRPYTFKNTNTHPMCHQDPFMSAGEIGDSQKLDPSGNTQCHLNLALGGAVAVLDAELFSTSFIVRVTWGWGNKQVHYCLPLHQFTVYCVGSD